jgi:hypothetical protein
VSIRWVEFVQEPDGEQTAHVWIQESGSNSDGTCNVRRFSFTQGISVARAKKQLAKVEVTYPKRLSKRR